MSARDSHNGNDGAQSRPPTDASPAPLLPVPKAPANDNEIALMSSVVSFFGRHINWLIPTLALALFSLALLFR